jgi:large subunit ribosomal protein L15
MRLSSSTLEPAQGSKKPRRRVGRGIGCGYGKTCGRGHKGQSSRSGGSCRIGFEGGQMPIQQRVPKFGFSSRKARVTAEINLADLNALTDDVVSLRTLKAADLLKESIRFVKVICTGEIKRAVTIKGIRPTAAAKAAIEAAGGKVEGV